MLGRSGAATLLRRSAPFLACLLALTAAIAGCGDGSGAGDPAVQRYLKELDGALEGAGDFKSLAESLDSISDPELSETEGYQAGLKLVTEEAVLYGNAHDALEGVDPPGKAAEAHSQLWEAAGSLKAVFSDALTRIRIGRVNSGPEIVALFDEPAGRPQLELAQDRYAAACLELQRLAADAESEVDLGCPEDGSAGEGS